MKALLVLSLLLVPALLQAETFTCVDKQGNIHFSDTKSAFPKGCIQASVSEDITTANPEVARSVARDNERVRNKQAQEEAARKAAERQQAKAKALALAEKVDCTGIPGECGPGRSCVYQESLSGKVVGKGYCTSNEQASRDVMQANQLNDIKRGVGRINQRLNGW